MSIYLSTGSSSFLPSIHFEREGFLSPKEWIRERRPTHCSHNITGQTSIDFGNSGSP